MIAWSARELPLETRGIEILLGYALALGGIQGIDSLKALKLQHQSIFGVIPSRPNAFRSDVEQLKQLVGDTLANLSELTIPTGRPVATGPGWVLPTQESVNWDLADVAYQAPLGG